MSAGLGCFKGKNIVILTKMVKEWHSVNFRKSSKAECGR